MEGIQATRWHRHIIGISLMALLVLGLSLASCTSSSPTATSEPTATVPPTSTPEPTATAGPKFSDPVAHAGYGVFVSSGCSACHGQNGEGSTFAPALPAHTEGQVRRQVRAPVGFMPVFPPDKISASELDSLVAYIISLEGGHAHERPVDLGADMQMHHWMALFAAEDGDAQEAIHHVEHIIDLVQGDHLARMQNALAELQTGNIHDAGHEIEEMLAGVLEDELSGTTMHVTLALSSVRIDDAESAIHHMEHFAELADAANLEASNEILALALADNLTEAEHEIVELLESIGIGMETDAEHTSLQEVMEAIEQGDVATAVLELGHFIEGATGEELIKAQEAMRFLQEGDLHEAEDVIGEMLGIAHN